MKKITCLVASLRSGGAEHQMAILAELLAEKGYDVELVTYMSIPDHYTLSEKVKRVRIHTPKRALFKVPYLIYKFSRFKCDTIISFLNTTNFMCIAGNILHSKQKVIVGERNLTVGKPPRIDQILYKYLYKLTKFVVTNSYSQYDFLCGYNSELKPKLSTVTNYTDIEKYHPSVYKGNEIPKIVVFARYSKQKNYEMLVKAVGLARKSIDFEMHWYGEKRDFFGNFLHDYKKCEELVRDAGIEDTFILHDKTDKVDTVMKEYDAFCLPSLFEGFSNSISEAICCGMPVICSDVSDNHIMVEDGSNGLLFNPSDVNSISESISKFCKLSRDERACMAQKSRKKAETLFNKEQFVNSYIDLIEKEV